MTAEHATADTGQAQARRADAARFLFMLDEEAEEFAFQVFYDDKRNDFAQQIVGTLDELWQELDTLNSRGCGIFVCINEVRPGKKRRADNIVRVRSTFADFDVPDSAPEVWPLEPSMLVETSPGKLHAYWPVDGMPSSEFFGAQRAISGKLGSDPSMANLDRIMRVPGFFHMKNPHAPHLVRIVARNSSLPYSKHAIHSAFPPIVEAPQTPAAPTQGNDPVFSAIEAAGLILGEGAKGGWNITCPWESEHTTPSGPSSTMYFPPHTNHYAHGGFCCKHAHCADRKIGDLRAKLGIRAPVLELVPPLDEEPPPYGEELSYVNDHGPVQPGTQLVPSRQSLVPTVEEMDAARLTPTCFVENLVFADVAVLQAPGSTGKTTLVIFEAICMALGIPLYGNKILQTGWTLFVTAEDQRERLLARTREIARAMELTPEQMQVVRESVIIWDVCGLNLKLTFNENNNLIVTNLAHEIVAAHKNDPPIVVNFDPMVSFGVSEQLVNDNEQMIITAARVMVAGLDAMVRLIHHTGKGREGAKGLEMYAGRGGSALSDGARMVQCLSTYLPKDPDMGKPPMLCGLPGEGESLTVLARPKMSYSPPNQPFVWIKRKGFAFNTYEDDPKQSTQERQANKEAQVLRWIESQLKEAVPRFYNVSELREQYQAMDMPARELRAAVTGLKAAGKIVSLPVPKERNPTGQSSFMCPVSMIYDFS